MEGVRSENIFSELTTAWYDYSLAEELYHKGAYCWVIEAAYYSALHSLRALVHTSIKLTEYFVNNVLKIPPKFKSHAKFIELLLKCDKLAGKEVEEEIISDVINTLNLDADFLKKLGTALKAIKAAREIHVYQHLVVAHQVRAIPASYVKDISRLTLNTSFNIVVSCTDIIVNIFLEKIEDNLIKYCYLRHFIDEFYQFWTLLREENIEPAENLVKYLNRVENEVTRKIKKLMMIMPETDKEKLTKKYDDFIQLHRPVTHFSIFLREKLSQITDNVARVLKIFTESDNLSQSSNFSTSTQKNA